LGEPETFMTTTTQSRIQAYTKRKGKRDLRKVDSVASARACRIFGCEAHHSVESQAWEEAASTSTTNKIFTADTSS
jgi:hypothetical protein